MSTIKKYLFLFGFFSLLLSSCAIDDDIMINPCMDVFVDSYELMPATLQFVPYFDFESDVNIVFVNELEEEITYTKGVQFDFIGQSFFTRPCPELEGAEFKYAYDAQSVSTSLASDENPINFNFTLRTLLDSQDPESGKAKDVFTIFSFDEDEGMFPQFSVFTMVTDQRDSDGPLFEPESFDTMTFNNRTFNEVLKTNFSDPFIEVYVNSEFGIVAFKDRDDVLWALDRIE